MKIKKFFKKHLFIIIIIFLTILLHTAFFSEKQEIWWDSGVYIGMGKTIFSGGEIGIWEHIRPIFWPFILGSIWKIGLPVIITGKIIEFLMLLSSIIFIYIIGKKRYSKETGIIAAALLSSSTILFHINFQLYTEIPTMFFILSAYLFFYNNKMFFSGISATAAFLTKFPAGIFIALLFLSLLLKKETKKTIYFCIGTLFLIIPFLISNIILYGTILGGFFAAQTTINKVLGCNLLRKQEWYYYFFALIYYESKFFIASILGAFNKIKKNKLILFSALIPLIYFINLNCKDYRYVTLFLPFLAILTGAGITLLLNKIKKTKIQKTIFILILLIILFSGYQKSITFHSEEQKNIINQEECFTYFKNITAKGYIWTSNPTLTAYSDLKFEKIYYPVYEKDIALNFFELIKKEKNNIEYVFLDNCGGGIICHPEDKICEKKREETIEYLNNNFKILLNKTEKNCWCTIYKNPIFE
jgi:hypothetical protein